MKTKVVAMVAIAVIAVVGIAGLLYINGQDGGDNGVKVPSAPSGPDEPNTPIEPEDPSTPGVPPENKHPIDSVRTDLKVGDYILLQSTDRLGNVYWTVRMTIVSFMDDDCLVIRGDTISPGQTLQNEYTLQKEQFITYVYAGYIKTNSDFTSKYDPDETVLISTPFGDRLCDRYVDKITGADTFIGVGSDIMYKMGVNGKAGDETEYHFDGYLVLLDSSLITRG